jgi:hypothetical protein
MSDQTLYDTMARTSGSLALAHQKGIRFKNAAGTFINITGDVNNLALNPTPITVPSEVYGNKSTPAMDVIGYSFAPTFTVEAIRDPSTKQIAQAWLIELLSKAFASGAANKGEFQLFDLLDENVPAFEGSFSVSVTEGATGYQDKGTYAFTLNSDGIVDQITSPVAGDGTPLIESVGPAGQAVGEQVVIRGYNFTGTTGITIDAQAVGTATEDFTVVDANTIVATIPATVAGAAEVIVTNAAGASDAFAYTAAA